MLSASAPKADIERHKRHVRFVPIASESAAAKSTAVPFYVTSPALGRRVEQADQHARARSRNDVDSTPGSSSAATAPAISVRFGAPPPSTSAIVMLRPFSSFDYATKIFCQSPEPLEYPARVAPKLP